MQMADRILVIDEGGVAEEGTYDDLMTRKGRSGNSPLLASGKANSRVAFSSCSVMDCMDYGVPLFTGLVGTLHPGVTLAFTIAMCYRLSVSPSRNVSLFLLFSILLCHLHRILLLPLIAPSASLALSSSLPVSPCTLDDAHYLAVF
jgi:hypothetical protein